jgi:hypothetical protein
MLMTLSSVFATVQPVDENNRSIVLPKAYSHIMLIQLISMISNLSQEAAEEAVFQATRSKSQNLQKGQKA